MHLTWWYRSDVASHKAFDVRKISSIVKALRCTKDRAGEIADVAHLNGGAVMFSGMKIEYLP